MATALRCKDKVVIVTGGCKGIGKACVDVFLEQGAKVAILDIDEVGSQLATENERIHFIKCDTSKEDQIKISVENVAKKFGQIDCLINNAGIFTPSKPSEEISVEEFQRTLDVNLIGYFLMCKHTLPHLRKTKGNVINIASMSAPLGYAGSPMYAASKGGVISMSKNYACVEAKHGVRVNSICPGMIQSDMFEQFRATCDEHLLNTMKDYTLQRRFGETREVALTCLFLVTDGTYFTGTDVTPHGGLGVGLGVNVMNM